MRLFIRNSLALRQWNVRDRDPLEECRVLTRVIQAEEEKTE